MLLGISTIFFPRKNESNFDPHMDATSKIDKCNFESPALEVKHLFSPVETLFTNSMITQ